MYLGILNFAVLAMVILPGAGWVQTPIPMRDGNGTTWLYGIRGISPGPLCTPRRTAPVRPRTWQQPRKPAQPPPPQRHVLSDREFVAPNLRVTTPLKLTISGLAGSTSTLILNKHGVRIAATGTGQTGVGIAQSVMSASPTSLSADAYTVSL